jgi:hypothetical protein
VKNVAEVRFVLANVLPLQVTGKVKSTGQVIPGAQFKQVINDVKDRITLKKITT